MKFINNPVNDWLNSTAQKWLEEHPLIGWILTHPVGSAILAVVILILFWGLLGFIGTSAQNLWGLILGTPFRVIKKLFQQLLKIQPKGAEAEIRKIIQEIEDLQQQQAKLFQRLQTLLRK